jgi:hypothetical protein
MRWKVGVDDERNTWQDNEGSYQASSHCSARGREPGLRERAGAAPRADENNHTRQYNTDIYVVLTILGHSPQMSREWEGRKIRKILRALVGLGF